MNDDTKKLDENLKKIREKKNITQTGLAQILNIDKFFVSNIENKKNNQTILTIIIPSKVLKVSVNKFFL